MKYFLTLLACIFASLSLHASHKVYVIHGYGSAKFFTRELYKSIQHEGFYAENYEYNSLQKDLDSIGRQLYHKIKKEGLDTVSFATHSMGGLVVRSMLKYSLQDKEFPVIFRVVMIAPPNKGAEIADFYSSAKILKKLLGPNVEHMKTDSCSYASKLPVPYNSEIGIIAGIRGNKYGYNIFIKGDNDGLLTPERTKLGVEKDFILIKEKHNLMTHKRYVCKLVNEFLKYGVFITR